MIRPDRFAAIASTLALCLAVSGCTGTGDDQLTITGSYSGTTASECQLALRYAGTWKLVESHAVGPAFQEQFAVEPKADRYYVEIHCPDGKQGNSAEFDFRPPRERIDLARIDLE